MQHHSSHTEDPGNIPGEHEQPLAGVQVLLVEDELEVADLLLFILHDAGAHAVWAMHSNDASACLHHFHPDILLCNILLLGRDGDWLIQEIRQAELETMAHLPVIAMTCYTREVTENTALAAGFDRFMHLLFDPTEMIEIILDVL
ncbi:MAG TPA: response regulator [Stenomitos sp.]